VEARWSSQLDATYEGWWLDPKGKDFGPNAKYFQHDIAEAKKLLAAAGYPNGFESTSHYVTGPELNPVPKTAPVLDGFLREIGITTKVDSVDYLKDYVPNYRDGRGQYAGHSFSSSAGAPTGSSAIGVLAGTFWSKSGASFRGFSTSGKNDQAGDPQVDAFIEKARVELDTEKRRNLVFDLQRYLAKTMYMLLAAGRRDRPHRGLAGDRELSGVARRPAAPPPLDRRHTAAAKKCLTQAWLASEGTARNPQQNDGRQSSPSCPVTTTRNA